MTTEDFLMDFLCSAEEKGKNFHFGGKFLEYFLTDKETTHCQDWRMIDKKEHQFSFWEPPICGDDVSQGRAGMTFDGSGTGRELKKPIPEIREREGNWKSPFPKFGNGKGIKKSIPKFREWEGNEKIPFPKFGNGKGMKKIHSQNSGTGREWKNPFPKFGKGNQRPPFLGMSGNGNSRSPLLFSKYSRFHKLPSS